MTLIFNEGQVDEKITQRTLKKITGYNRKEIIGLTGISYDDPVINTATITIKGIYPLLRITIRAIALDIAREVNFKSRVIENISFEIKNEDNIQKGIGIHILYNQINYARTLGFSKIILEAVGDPSTIFLQNGYYTWARFGFSPIKKSKEDFNEFLRLNNFPKMNMQKFMSDKDRRGYWKNHGFPWHGEFLLKEGSLNNRHFSRYLKEKKFDIKH